MLFEKIEFEAGEKVLKTVRKHWFIIVAELLVSVLLLLLPFFIALVIWLSPINLETMEINLAAHQALLAFAFLVWAILVLFMAFTAWTNYFLDLWVITDRRIIVVDHVRFFHRNVGIFRLEKLQDIEFTVSGILPMLFSFGTIKAQTAGAYGTHFETNGLPDPRGLQSLIQKATDERMAALKYQFDTNR